MLRQITWCWCAGSVPLQALVETQVALPPTWRPSSLSGHLPPPPPPTTPLCQKRVIKTAATAGQTILDVLILGRADNSLATTTTLDTWLTQQQQKESLIQNRYCPHSSCHRFTEGKPCVSHCVTSEWLAVGFFWSPPLLVGWLVVVAAQLAGWLTGRQRVVVVPYLARRQPPSTHPPSYLTPAHHHPCP